MQRLIISAVLPLALALTLGGCSDEPEPKADETPTASPSSVATAPTAPAVKAPPPPPTLAPATTAYERALRALTSGTSVHFESEVALSDGSSQYATGFGQNLNYAITVRSLPKADNQLDGGWLLQSGRYLKESAGNYDGSVLNPVSASILFDALVAVPQSESAFTSDAPVAETTATAQCNSRKVDLAKAPHLFTQYRSLGICVDESKAQLIKLSAELQTGERLAATFTAHGQPVQLPQAQVKDWSQEYPRR